MRWFGAPWGAPINTDAKQAPTPVGERCIHCSRQITDHDQGLLVPYFGEDPGETIWHRDCLQRALGVKR